MCLCFKLPGLFIIVNPFKGDDSEAAFTRTSRQMIVDSLWHADETKTDGNQASFLWTHAQYRKVSLISTHIDIELCVASSFEWSNRAVVHVLNVVLYLCGGVECCPGTLQPTSADDHTLHNTLIKYDVWCMFVRSHLPAWWTKIWGCLREDVERPATG